MTSISETFQFKTLVENSPAGVFYTDNKGAYLYTNLSWQKMFGLSAEQCLGDGWTRTLHKADFERVVSGWQNAVSNEQKFAMEFCTRFDDGKVRYILAKAKPIYLEEKLQGFLGSVEDITERHVLQQVISEREKSYARLLGNLSGMAYRCLGDAGRSVIYVSAGCEELTGYGQSEFFMSNSRNLDSLIYAEDQECIARTISGDVERKLPFRCEYRLVKANNEVIWVWDQGEGVYDDSGKLLFIEGMLTDLSPQKKVEDDLRSERNLLSTIINSSTDFIFAKDKNLRTFLCNEIFAAAVGAKPEDLYGKTDIENGWDELMVKGCPEKGIRGYEQDDKAALAGNVVRNSHDHVLLDGELRIYDTVKLPLKDAQGDIIGVLGIARDATEASLAAEKIWYQANYDALTKLPNRSMFTDRLRQQIKKSRREKTQCALLFVDLDHFKKVNDTLGHESGDKLLVSVAERILNCVRESDTVSRFAGDEFTLMLPDFRVSQDIEKITRSIHTSLEAPIDLDGEPFFISASIGIAIYPDDSEDISELLRFADQAMYAAKRSGRGKSCFFTPKLQEDADRRRRLVADLKLAIQKDQLQLYFQPIVNLQHGGVKKAEALIRWQHPRFGLLNPADFMPLAEEEGLVVDIGNWVFQTAAHQVKSWQLNFHPEFQVSVNNSPAQFYDSENQKLPDWIEFLNICGLTGSSVSVEITEGMLLEHSNLVTDKLFSYREAGMQVALDDFGTGYSAMSYLKKFDIDYIKIDRSFVNNIEKRQEDLVMCEAIIAMAHKMGLKVVAEGVESSEQYQIIRSLNCDYAQGFYFAKPMSSRGFDDFMIRYSDNWNSVSVEPVA